jgi:hypothetical protein
MHCGVNDERGRHDEQTGSRASGRVRRLQDGRPPTAVRYPSTVRRTVAALARRRQADGVDLRTIAHDVGVAPWTSALWLRKPASPSVRAVEVVSEPLAARAPAGRDPVLITPRGLRVEGLDRDTLVAILRALG